MDSSNIVGAAKFVVPKLPLLVKTALFHSLNLSDTSHKLDLKSDLLVKLIRAELCKPAISPISKQQKIMNKDQPVKGNLWVSRTTLPAPEEDVRALLCQAIDDMKEGEETYTIPETKPVEGEWHGYRGDCGKDAPEPKISEEEKYRNIMKETKNEGVVLYFHGGAYVVMDPASHRPTTSKYAHLLGGRVFSVRYRLAPQNPFPAALLDAFVAYLSLLHPPPGSLHEPVSADKIIVGGDSAGGNLATVLLQFLLQTHRSSPGRTPTVLFHGKEVEIPLPGGLALSSPWTDITRSMPSIETNAHYDYLPPASATAQSQYPSDSVWPTDPPRATMYCEGSALCHPLVSPLAAKDWTGAPPFLFMVGEEMMADESTVFAQRMASQGVKVVWKQYEAMPHCFALLLEGNTSASLAFTHWEDFAKAIVERPTEVSTSGEWVAAKTLAAKEVDVEHLTELTDEKTDEMMRAAMERMSAGIEGDAKVQPRL